MTTTNISARSRTGLALQDVVEQLSTALHRATSVTTLDSAVHVASASRPTGLRAVEDAADLERSARSLILDIRSNGAVVGHLRVAAGDLPPLTAAQYESIDSAVALAAEIIGERTDDTHADRATVMGRLLSPRADERREAFADAVGRLWLQRGEGTVVRALLTDTAAGAVERLAFGRYLATLRPVPLWLAGDRPGLLFFVGAAVDPSVDRMIIEEGGRRGIRILGIGTATPLRSTADLADTADRAATAAELSSSFEEFQPAVDIDALGGWTLLNAVKWDPSWLPVISPAAEALTSHGDETQRRTIETLLDVGGQVTAACELLFVHRTTLYYRLEKMPEIVREAMADGMKRSTLHLALKLVRLWEATGRI